MYCLHVAKVDKHVCKAHIVAMGPPFAEHPPDL